jgi:5'-nucleotidase
MDPSVDAIIAGHSHTLINTTVNGKLIVEAYRYGTAFDDVTLRISKRTGDVVEKSATIVPVYDDEIQPQGNLAALVADFKARIAPLSNQVVGATAAPITRSATAAGESALGDLIADAQRQAMGTDIAVMNPGGIRADVPAGDVTFGALFAVQPFDNGMVKTSLTGAQIRQALDQQFAGSPPKILQVSGLTWKRSGTTVSDVQVAGAPLDDARTYTVAMNSFLATGGDGFTALAGGTNTTSDGNDLDALVAYVKGLPQPLTAPDPTTAPRITGG